MFVESHVLLYAYLFQIQQKNDVKNTLREERYFFEIHTYKSPSPKMLSFQYRTYAQYYAQYPHLAYRDY
jgi:hypothetical protein